MVYEVHQDLFPSDGDRGGQDGVRIVLKGWEGGDVSDMGRGLVGELLSARLREGEILVGSLREENTYSHHGLFVVFVTILEMERGGWVKSPVKKRKVVVFPLSLPGLALLN